MIEDELLARSAFSTSLDI